MPDSAFLSLLGSLGAIQFRIVMQPLYKAYACEKIGEETLLLPGYPIDSTSKSVPAGKKIKVELADGTWLETTVVQTKPMTFDESMIEHLKLRAKPNTFYYAIQVPDGFSVESIFLGVNVYLDG